LIGNTTKVKNNGLKTWHGFSQAALESIALPISYTLLRFTFFHSYYSIIAAKVFFENLERSTQTKDII